jgi:hypothetical protein
VDALDRKRQRMLKCQLLAMRPEGGNYLWRKMLWGCGEDIASIGAVRTDEERPMQKLNDLSRSLTPLDPDGTLFRGRPDHWRVWSWQILLQKSF